MSMRRMATLQAGLLLVAMFANAASRNTMRIKVLDSETRSLNLDDNGVPRNCDQVTFDAYCRSTRTSPMVNTLLVQEGNEAPFRISCTIESKYSRCTPLPKGESFDARRERHGVTVYYIDDNGKARKQLYTLVDTGGKADRPATVAAVATQPAPHAAVPPQNSPAPAPVPQTATPVQNSPAPAPAPQAAAPLQNAPVPAPAPPLASAQGGASQKVKCNFSSTPSGAEISIDWRYVGNTPSEISLSTGTHVIVISMPGFAEWKRELTVAADSVVNVTASLQKTQP